MSTNNVSVDRVTISVAAAIAMAVSVGGLYYWGGQQQARLQVLEEEVARHRETSDRITRNESDIRNLIAEMNRLRDRRQ